MAASEEYLASLISLYLGFDYQFNAIQNESNELFSAYKEMFEIAISQGQGMRAVLGLYFPILNIIWVCVTLYPSFLILILILKYSLIKPSIP